MKQRGLLYKLIFLLIFVVAVALLTYYLVSMRKPPAIEQPREVVKSFSFQEAKDLEEWDEKKLSRHATKYEVAEDQEGKHVRAVGENSASALYYKEKLVYSRNPFISWKWKAVKFPLHKKKENLKGKSEFDFVAQVYVIFYARFILNSEALLYVWAEDMPKGTTGHSPYTEKVKILVLESGEPDTWKKEERNIREDYLNLFGKELDKDVMAISFMTDADSTNSTAEALLDDIEIGYLPTKEEGKIDLEEIEAPRLPKVSSMKKLSQDSSEETTDDTKKGGSHQISK